MQTPTAITKNNNSAHCLAMKSLQSTIKGNLFSAFFPFGCWGNEEIVVFTYIQFPSQYVFRGFKPCHHVESQRLLRWVSWDLRRSDGLNCLQNQPILSSFKGKMTDITSPDLLCHLFQGSSDDKAKPQTTMLLLLQELYRAVNVHSFASFKNALWGKQCTKETDMYRLQLWTLLAVIYYKRNTNSNLVIKTLCGISHQLE